MSWKNPEPLFRLSDVPAGMTAAEYARELAVMLRRSLGQMRRRMYNNDLGGEYMSQVDAENVHDFRANYWLEYGADGDAEDNND